MNCVFCDIIERKANAEIIFEDEKIISFLDINPLNHGHTLVVTKNHYEDFLSLPKEELDQVIHTTQLISGGIRKSLNTDGINIISNNGKAANQSVFHFHFHIIPRFINDGLRFNPVFKDYGSKQMKEYAEKIKSALV